MAPIVQKKKMPSAPMLCKMMPKSDRTRSLSIEPPSLAACVLTAELYIESSCDRTVSLPRAGDPLVHCHVLTPETATAGGGRKQRRQRRHTAVRAHFEEARCKTSSSAGLANTT